MPETWRKSSRSMANGNCVEVSDCICYAPADAAPEDHDHDCADHFCSLDCQEYANG